MIHRSRFWLQWHSPDQNSTFSKFKTADVHHFQNVFCHYSALN